MIRHRLRRLAEATVVVSTTASLCLYAYANPVVSSVDTNQPTTCTPVTATPYAGVMYQVYAIASDTLHVTPIPEALNINVVAAGIEEVTDIEETETNNEETNDEEQSAQSTTTDEYPKTADEIKVEEVETPVQYPLQEDESNSDSSDHGVESEPGSSYVYTGTTLNRHRGRVNGPSGQETFYNLNMSYCVSRMQSLGYDYQYWVREDGVKMLGPYIMVAADFSIRPLGTVVDTSLGQGIVCDTGTFIYTNPTALDIATTW